MRILFFPAGDYKLASTRLQVYERVKALRKYGIKADIVLKLKRSNKKRNIIRFFVFPFIFWHYDVIFFQKTTNLICYVFAKLSNLFGKKTLFHTDDYITQEIKGTIRMFKTCDISLVASHFLLNIANKYSNHVYILPPFADIKIFKIKHHKNKKNIILGWLGRTLSEDLELIIPVIRKISKKYNVTLKIIGRIDKKILLELSKYSKTIDTGWIDPLKVPNELLKIDIALLPLKNDILHRAALPTKLLEYMAAGLPVVASAVGEVKYIIKDGKNGFIANNLDEWKNKLEALIKNYKLRNKIGYNARLTIMKKYTLEKTTSLLIKILNQ